MDKIDIIIKACELIYDNHIDEATYIIERDYKHKYIKYQEKNE